MLDTATVLAINRGRAALRVGDYSLMPGVPTPVPVGYVAMYGSAPNVEWDFSALAEHLRSTTDDGRPYFDFWCPLSAKDGYGRHALDVWKGLNAIGSEAVLHASTFVQRDGLEQAILDARSVGEHRPPAKVALAFTIPYDPLLTNGRIQSPIRIVLTQFETDHVPAKHVEVVNRFRHLIVTSSFQPSVWRRSGCTAPISVMTPGIDTDAFPFVERPLDGTFKVLILGALSPRKNPEGALRIFQEASQGNPDWRLTIKTRGRLAEELASVARRDKRVTFLNGDYGSNQVVALYGGHDCLLWPSRGEGVGLPPLEAMSTGMEVVCSDNSGMQDYLGPDWSYPIKTAGLRPASDGTWQQEYIDEFGDVGNYWEPDHRHAVKQLRKCFNNWLDGKGKGRKAAAYVRANHTLRHQAESVLRVVQEYL